MPAETHTMYMHTIEERPATYSKADGQIVFADVLPRWKDKPQPVTLRASVRQIRIDQKRTMENRKSWGFQPDASNRYGYVLVEVPNV